jgi:hypothetical protein
MRGRSNLISRRTTAKKGDFAPKAKKSDLSSTKSSPVDQILNLQQTSGNQSVQDLFKSGILQPKLKIGQPGDKYELEADRIAEEVMWMPDSVCPTCIEKNEELIQPKVQGSNITEMSPDVESGIDSLRGSGQPLSKSVRNYFEPRFRYDFSGVRVHTGEEANETAKSINARAFTLGKDIVLGADVYAMETGEGRRLLAHELTHVVQQGRSSDIFIQRAPVDDVTNMTILPSYADALSDEDLLSCINALEEQLKTFPTDSLDYDTARSNLAIIEAEATSRNLFSPTYLPDESMNKKQTVKKYPYDPDYGPSEEHCAVYQSSLAETWFTYSYRNNAECACLRTPNEPHNNCVRKCLQVKMLSHLREQSRMGRALPWTFPLEADPMCYDMWEQHVECYRECGCDNEFINYPVFSTMCRAPFPCAFVAGSIDWFNACIEGSENTGGLLKGLGPPSTDPESLEFKMWLRYHRRL